MHSHVQVLHQAFSALGTGVVCINKHRTPLHRNKKKVKKMWSFFFKTLPSPKKKKKKKRPTELIGWRASRTWLLRAGRKAMTPFEPVTTPRYVLLAGKAEHCYRNRTTTKKIYFLPPIHSRSTRRWYTTPKRVNSIQTRARRTPI